MRIKEIIESKKAWRAHVARIKALPAEYRFVYRQIQKYIFKACPAQPDGGMELLYGIAGLFEESAARGKTVLEVTGSDVAAFCDGLLLEPAAQADACRNAGGTDMQKPPQ